MYKYFICLVSISSYEGADYVVGIFDDLSLATTAKEAFVNSLTSAEEQFINIVSTDDKNTNVIKEPKVVEYKSLCQLLSPIYITSIFNEGFGQIYRKIDSILDSKEAAQLKIKALELKAEEITPSFPEYFSLEKLEINQLNRQSISQWLEHDYFGDDDYLV
ncbi:hypothetical protein M2263_000769 [Providencia alcalifaciens]|nr:hypothetical protein [Providencia alcalifaciens]